MKRAIVWAAPLLAAAVALSGCAGGWRGGTPPGSAEAPVAAAGTAPAVKGAAGAPGATQASAAGVTFLWKGEGSSVALAGEFNGWNTTADPMTKQADGSWAVTKKLEPGRYAYKFVVDGSTWKEDPAAKETTDDGYGGKNSVIVVGGAAGTAAPAPAAPVAAPAGKGKPPAPTADGVVFTFAGGATSVALAGEFNGWSTTTDSMTKQADGTWTIAKKLAPGTYAYKFVVNGTTWKQDDANSEAKDDGFGGKNSLVTVK